MASRKTHFGFMALGCLVGLLVVAAITKLLEDSKAAAREGQLPHMLARALEDAKARPADATSSEPPPAPALQPPAGVPLPARAPEHPEAGKSAEPAAADNDKLPPALPPIGAEAPPAPATPVAPPVVPPPAIAPERTPGAAPPPQAEAKPETLPPPLPTADSVPPPPPNELRPIPLPPPGDPLPPLPANAVEKKVEPPARLPIGDPKTEVIPVSLTPAPPPPVPAPGQPTWSNPTSAPPSPATMPPAPIDIPAGTPLPPVESPSPASGPKLSANREPPLAPAPGPVVPYQVRGSGETMREIARRTLGGDERWPDIHRLNPGLQPEAVIVAGATVSLPADACIRDDETVQPLPSMRPKATPPKPKVVLPLTGTFPANLDDKKALLLPRAIRDQLGACDTLLVSPGSDECLWVTNPTHLDRLGDRLEHSPARELDVRTFKRLYFAQTEKVTVADDGRITLPDRLAQFAGLRQEVVLVGIDDHFEVWDASKWRQYTQQNSAAARAALADRE